MAMRTIENPMIKEAIIDWKEKKNKPVCAYLYDLKGLQEHVKNLSESLPHQCRLFYAVKANADVKILQALQPYVTGFEIASIGELNKVRSVSSTIPMIFGGPGKTDEELRAAIANNISFIHVESVFELQRLNWIAEQYKMVVPILLRVNLQTTVPEARLKMAGLPTQFGIDETQIPLAIQITKEMKHVKLHGFHFHAMSNNLDEKQHVLFVKHCLEQTDRWEKEFAQCFSVVNVGGGVGIHYAQPDKRFDWESFSNQLQLILKQHAHPRWTVVFELGRYITAHHGYYAAEILDIKKNHGKNFAVLRGGTHHLRLPAAWKMNHPFSIIPIEQWDYPFERFGITQDAVTIVGELCTPNDVLARDVFCPSVRVGDIVLFECAGAYGWDISHSQFLSHPYPEFIYLE
jgi:2-[(L-alanin-3-ylcarbamoyl)methyl]-2-hydroxybutanedioate decarboxylase